MRVRSGLRVAILFQLAGTCAASIASEAKPLAPVLFLLGSWEAGENSGQPGQGTGDTTFRMALQGAVIVRENHAHYPAQKEKPASDHDDLMVIAADPNGLLHADYWDNEGHVIRYLVSSAADGTLTMLSEPVAGSPRFRLVYTALPGGSVAGEFSIAPPGSPDGFKTYLKWEMKRKGAGRGGR